jgi:hypothetical protein
LEIVLNGGNVLIIDDADYEYVSKHVWRVSKGRAIRREYFDGNCKAIYLHRDLLNPPENLVVDHINGNALDNRRENLRICTHSQNSMNKRKPINGKKSSFKGVMPQRGKYTVIIKREGKAYCEGTYETEIEAAIAYNQKAEELFGEFAKLNEIPKQYSEVKPKRVQGTSKYRGVSFNKRSKKWEVVVQHNKERHFVGSYGSECAAAQAYNEKAIEIKGAKARLNEIDGELE